ncbi:MAG: Sensor histidine kinase RcsC [Verrucomicrobiae bacterium]|nr:Sensor histidine kinase RcsC [Verrucomicrobiae bacterium]
MKKTLPLQKYRILIVDQHPFTAQLIARMLVRRGFRVAIAADGPDALDWLAEEKFDAVLSEMFLPGNSGLDLLRRIHRLFPRLPVALMSAFLADELHQSALAEGAVEFFKKPVSSQALVELFARARQTRPMAELVAA